MNLSLEEAEKLLKKKDTVTIDLNKENVKHEKSKAFLCPENRRFSWKEKEDLIIKAV